MVSTQHEMQIKPRGISTTREVEKTGLSRKNSRSRGINFKTVSPNSGSALTGASLNKSKRNVTPPQTTISQDSSIPRVEESSEEYLDEKPLNSAPKSATSMANLDSIIPTSADLENLDLNDKLRLLALKEMAVVELKDTMAELQAKLYASERDLQSLRTIIQRSLYRQLKNEAQIVKMPRETHAKGKESQVVSCSNSHSSNIASNTVRKPRPAVTSKSASLNHKQPLKENNGTSITTHNKGNTQPAVSDDPQSKLWANLAKPITFIQNLDHMLSQEFERSLVGETVGVNRPTRTAVSEKQVVQNPERFENNDKNDNNDNNDNDNNNQFRQLMDNKLAGLSNKDTSDDMFQAVSNSLWGFVNDMKTNMVSSLVPEPWPIQSDDESHKLKEQASDLTESLERANGRESPADLLEFSDEDEDEDGEEDIVDLSMYSAMRQNRKE